jgi:hypothetical protein
MNGVGRPLFFALVLLAGYLTLVLGPFLVALTGPPSSLSCFRACRPLS